MDIKALSVLSEPTRCKILILLSKKAYCVSALAHLLGISPPAVSQHLKVLREAGLVYSKKFSYQTHYLLDRKHLSKIAEDILEIAKENTNSCRSGGFSCEAAEKVCKKKEVD